MQIFCSIKMRVTITNATDDMKKSVVAADL